MEPHMSSPSPCKLKIIRKEVLHLFRCYISISFVSLSIYAICMLYMYKFVQKLHTNTYCRTFGHSFSAFYMCKYVFFLCKFKQSLCQM